MAQPTLRAVITIQLGFVGEGPICVGQVLIFVD